MNKFFLKKFDWVLFGTVLALIGLSFLTFYNLDSDSGQLLKKQAILVAISLVVMFSLAMFDYRIFKNHSLSSVIVYVVALILLGLALASSEIRGVSSWIVLSEYTFQPAEFAKIAVVILLAKYFSQKHSQINDIRHIFASAIYAGIPFLMVFIQPDFGSAIVFAVVWLTLAVFSGINKKHFAALVILSTIIMMVAWIFVLENYQKDRILSFVDPYSDPKGQGYHLIQSKIAIGSGRLIGSVWGSGKGTDIKVPEPDTDFIFTSFSNRFGFLGVLTVSGLFVLLMVRLISIASREAKNNFSQFFIIGFSAILFTHITINIGMNLGLLPITGIPLPFLSYGGSHLISIMAGIGLVQSIKVHG